MSDNNRPIRIESICIVHKSDDNPVEDEMDEMGEIGIFVEAEVSYPISQFSISDQKYLEHRRMETLKSAGLWGVAVDSPFDYKMSVEKEQLEDLKNHLSIFGVDVSNFHEIQIQMRCE